MPIFYCSNCETEFKTTFIFKKFKLYDEETGEGFNEYLNYPEEKKIMNKDGIEETVVDKNGKVILLFKFCTKCFDTYLNLNGLSKKELNKLKKERLEIDNKITEVKD